MQSSMRTSPLSQALYRSADSRNDFVDRWQQRHQSLERRDRVAQSQHGTRFFENASTTAPKESLPIDTFLTPTTGKFQKKRSVVAALAPNANGTSTLAVVGVPPINETRAQVEAQLATMSKRQSRLPLVSSEATRAAFSKAIDGNMVPAWMRLLANFPE